MGDTKIAIGQAIKTVGGFQFIGIVGENGGVSATADKFVDKVEKVGIAIATPSGSRQAMQDFITRGKRGEGFPLKPRNSPVLMSRRYSPDLPSTEK